MKKDAVLAVILIVFDLVYASQIWAMPPPFKQGEPGPAFLPILLALILFVAAVAILIDALRSNTNSDDGDRRFLRPFLVMVSTALFVTLLYFFGYWIATPFFTFSIMMIFEAATTKPMPRTVGFSALNAFCLTGFGWLFFEELFDLPLPEGIY